MKTILTAAILSLSACVAQADSAGPVGSEGLYLLATTGSGDVRAEEGYGTSYHKTGGSPAKFTYEVDTPWQSSAMMLLKSGEFLAPHFIKNHDGSVDVMIAPHLFITESNRTINMLTGDVGTLVKGAGQPDNFIRVSRDGIPTRYDYSRDIILKGQPAHGGGK